MRRGPLEAQGVYRSIYEIYSYEKPTPERWVGTGVLDDDDPDRPASLLHRIAVGVSEFKGERMASAHHDCFSGNRLHLDTSRSGRS